MLDWLGQKGVNIEGGPALDALLSMRKRLVEKRSHVESEFEKKCAKDAEYLAAVAEREAIPKDPEVPVPPKYVSGDFISAGGARYWALRGKLDVPKERWVSFPHCEGPDGTLVFAWAGYDHLQLARAVSEYYVRVQTELGGSEDPRLVPLLACLIELLPWLKQWHNEPDAAFGGTRMGDYFEGFINEEARTLGKTIPEIKSWQPPARTGGRRRRSAT